MKPKQWKIIPFLVLWWILLLTPPTVNLKIISTSELNPLERDVCYANKIGNTR